MEVCSRVSWPISLKDKIAYAHLSRSVSAVESQCLSFWSSETRLKHISLSFQAESSSPLSSIVVRCVKWRKDKSKKTVTRHNKTFSAVRKSAERKSGHVALVLVFIWVPIKWKVGTRCHRRTSQDDRCGWWLNGFVWTSLHWIGNWSAYLALEMMISEK